jgi:branched-chain amino acid transport system ATP-binding protein
MLSLSSVVISYGQLEVVHGIDLKVGKGELVAVLGPNGAGKSTLLNAIAGIVRIRSGSISLDDKSIGRLPSHLTCRAGISLVPQGRELFPEMTVRENLDLGVPTSARRAAGPERIEDVLRLFPRLRERVMQPAGGLSGGERAMLAIGRALVARPSVLLLDEPTAGLAPKVVDQVRETLMALKAGGQTTILVEQNVNMALAMADSVYLMNSGKLARKDDVRESKDLFESFIG